MASLYDGTGSDWILILSLADDRASVVLCTVVLSDRSRAGLAAVVSDAPPNAALIISIKGAVTRG